MELDESWIDGSWWEVLPAEAGMKHKVSGERIIYRGEGKGSLRYRFEYLDNDRSIPLVIEIKQINYPNPTWRRNAGSGSYHEVDWEYALPKKITACVWVLNYREQVDLSDTNRSILDNTSYNAWRRLDIALREAAMLWQDTTSSVPRADEFAVRGGWLNGRWEDSLFRRFKWNERIDDIRWSHLLLKFDKDLKPPHPTQIPMEAFGSGYNRTEPPSWIFANECPAEVYGLQVTAHFKEVFSGIMLGSIEQQFQADVPRYHRVLLCWGEFLIGRIEIEAYRHCINLSARRTDRTECASFWDADIWEAMISFSPYEFPPTEQGGNPTRIDFQSEDWKRIRETSTVLKFSYHNFLTQIDACENSLMMIPLLGKRDDLRSMNLPSDKQINIKYYPIGGKRAGIASIRRSIVPTRDNSLEAWIQCFGKHLGAERSG